MLFYFVPEITRNTANDSNGVIYRIRQFAAITRICCVWNYGHLCRTSLALLQNCDIAAVFGIAAVSCISHLWCRGVPRDFIAVNAQRRHRCVNTAESETMPILQATDRRLCFRSDPLFLDCISWNSQWQLNSTLLNFKCSCLAVYLCF